MAWCEANGVDYILGLLGNKVLDRLVETTADDVRVRRAEAQAPVVRRYIEVRYGAKSWRCERRVGARIEATTKGLDIRVVVTNIAGGHAEWLYDTLYCARGQAENLIKLHKSQLASDRTSCRSPLANQVRLVLHTGAYWLMLGLRDAIPKPQTLARAHPADAPDQDRSSHRRDRQPRPHRLRSRTSRSGAVRQSRAPTPPRRTMTQGALAPHSLDPLYPSAPTRYDPIRDVKGAPGNRVRRQEPYAPLLTRRVEDGRSGLGHPASPCFPSPLIERSVRISRTTLSD